MQIVCYIVSITIIACSMRALPTCPYFLEALSVSHQPTTQHQCTVIVWILIKTVKQTAL